MKSMKSLIQSFQELKIDDPEGAFLEEKASLVKIGLGSGHHRNAYSEKRSHDITARSQ